MPEAAGAAGEETAAVPQAGRVAEHRCRKHFLIDLAPLPLAAEPQPVIKRSLTIRGHSTSISIEAPFWDRLHLIAKERGTPLARLVADIDAGRSGNTNLSSAVRVFVLREALGRLEPRPPIASQET